MVAAMAATKYEGCGEIGDIRAIFLAQVELVGLGVALAKGHSRGHDMVIRMGLANGQTMGHIIVIMALLTTLVTLVTPAPSSTRTRGR